MPWVFGWGITCLWSISIKTITIFGGGGFIGSRIRERLQIDESLSVRVANRYGSVSPHKPLRDKSWLFENIVGSDIVIYCGQDQTLASSPRDIRYLVRECRKSRVKKIIYFSSISAFHMSGEFERSETFLPARVSDPYSVYKATEYKKFVDSFGSTLSKTIIVPGIVLDRERRLGNWDQYFKHANEFREIELPYDGFCLITDLKELVEKVADETASIDAEGVVKHRVVITDKKNWSSIYNEYGDTPIRVVSGPTWSPSKLKSCVMSLFFESILGRVFFKVFAKVRSRQKHIPKSDLTSPFRPTGVARTLHFYNES